jgi:hypothetical protein
MELLAAQATEDGIAVTFATEHGVERLEGSREEIVRLAEIMKQVSVLAALNETERVWLEDVVVGDALIKLGLNPGGQARVRILRIHQWS